MAEIGCVTKGNGNLFSPALRIGFVLSVLFGLEIFGLATLDLADPTYTGITKHATTAMKRVSNKAGRNIVRRDLR